MKRQPKPLNILRFPAERVNPAIDPGEIVEPAQILVLPTVRIERADGGNSGGSAA